MLKLQHFDITCVNSLALVSQILAKHLFNLISGDSSNHSHNLFWTAVQNSEITCTDSSCVCCVFFPAYLGFLWMLLLVAYGQRDPNSYYLNKHIESSFSEGFRDVYSYEDFFTWAKTTLVKNLYGSYKGAETVLISSWFTSACQLLKHYLLYLSPTCTCIFEWRKTLWLCKTNVNFHKLNTSG